MINYYTDGHDVDEDLRTIPAQGGRWNSESSTGTACRTMDDSPTAAIDANVAYKDKNITLDERVMFLMI